MRRVNILIMIVMAIMLMGLASAFLGTFKQGECVNIKTILNTAAVNISSVSYPNSSIAGTGLVMQKTDMTFNYSFCNTSALGTYVYDYYDSNGETYVNDFTITPSGSSIDQGQSTTLIGSIFLMVVVSLIFLFLAAKSEKTLVKTAFYSISAIGFIMTILYVVITIQQTLFGFDNILTGIETFWFVTKMGITVGMITLFVVLFLILLKAWKIKRGLIDVD